MPPPPPPPRFNLVYVECCINLIFPYLFFTHSMADKKQHLADMSSRPYRWRGGGRMGAAARGRVYVCSSCHHV